MSITCVCPGAELALKDGFRVDGAVTFVAESAQAAIASTAADVISEAATRFMKDPFVRRWRPAALARASNLLCRVVHQGRDKGVALLAGENGTLSYQSALKMSNGFFAETVKCTAGAVKGARGAEQMTASKVGG